MQAKLWPWSSGRNLITHPAHTQPSLPATARSHSACNLPCTHARTHNTHSLLTSQSPPLLVLVLSSFSLPPSRTCHPMLATSCKCTCRTCLLLCMYISHASLPYPCESTSLVRLILFVSVCMYMSHASYTLPTLVHDISHAACTLHILVSCVSLSRALSRALSHSCVSLTRAYICLMHVLTGPCFPHASWTLLPTLDHASDTGPCLRHWTMLPSLDRASLTRCFPHTIFPARFCFPFLTHSSCTTATLLFSHIHLPPLMLSSHIPCTSVPWQPLIAWVHQCTHVYLSTSSRVR